MMMRLKNLLSDARFVTAGITAAAAAAIGSAYTAQYGFGLQPCDLCLMQRVPFALAAALGLGGLFFAVKRQNPKAAAAFVLLSGLVFLAGGGIAFYHHGVEQHWWVSFLQGCKVNLDPENLLAQIESAQAVRCDEIPWADPLFHLSMAAWNAIISPLLAAGCFVSSLLITRKANGF